MAYLNRRTPFIRVPFLFVVAFALSGCSLAPGMRFNDRYTKAEPATGAPVVTPVLKTITPQPTIYQASAEVCRTVYTMIENEVTD